jgi:hypothetical protein
MPEGGIMRLLAVDPSSTVLLDPETCGKSSTLTQWADEHGVDYKTPIIDEKQERPVEEAKPKKPKTKAAKKLEQEMAQSRMI